MGHKYTIKLYPKAYRDLDGIYQYIYEHIQMPQYAESQLDRLEAGIFSLEDFPHRGPERKNGSYANRGYRELFVDNYVVIYKIRERKQQVDIVTVQYIKRNL